MITLLHCRTRAWYPETYHGHIFCSIFILSTHPCIQAKLRRWRGIEVFDDIWNKIFFFSEILITIYQYEIEQNTSHSIMFIHTGIYTSFPKFVGFCDSWYISFYQLFISLLTQPVGIFIKTHEVSFYIFFMHNLFYLILDVHKTSSYV